MDWYKLFSKELSICYFMQNEDLTDEEMEEYVMEDKSILEGILMELLINSDYLESLEEEDERI